MTSFPSQALPSLGINHTALSYPKHSSLNLHWVLCTCWSSTWHLFLPNTKWLSCYYPNLSSKVISSVLIPNHSELKLTHFEPIPFTSLCSFVFIFLLLIFVLFGFITTNFFCLSVFEIGLSIIYLWLSCNSLCTPGWSLTHKNPVPLCSTSDSAGFKVCAPTRHNQISYLSPLFPQSQECWGFRHVPLYLA